MNPTSISIIVLVIVVLWFILKRSSNKATDYTNIDKLIAEVDVYIAYGLHKKAMQTLNKVIKVNPNNTRIISKLNEVKNYHS